MVQASDGILTASLPTTNPRQVLASAQYPGAAARWPQGNADAVRLITWVLESPKLREVGYEQLVHVY